MTTIVALGNPEPEYAGTRHNVGRDAARAAFLAFEKDNSAHVRDWEKDSRTKSLIASIRVGIEPDHVLHFVMPNTFMNRSGTAVAECMKEKSPSDLIVLHDELDLPLGVVKIAHHKGAGGHNGVQSIIDHLKTNAFIRIRIGIGAVPKKAGEGAGEGIDLATSRAYDSGADYVLGRFTADERKVIDESLKKIAPIITAIREEGVEMAMNRFN